MEKVEFRGNNKTLASKKMKLNKIFPNMRILEIFVERLRDNNCIGVHFPRLENLDPDLFSNNFNAYQIKQMIKLNPQIRSLSIQRSSLEFLLTLRNLLPNLEHLVVSGAMSMQLQNTEDDIHFDSIKTLTFEGFEFFPQNVIFDRLQELYISSANDKFQFIQRHPTLKRL